MRTILVNCRVDKFKEPINSFDGREQKPVKTYIPHTKKFTSQAEVEKFLKRLQDLKIKLAFRCAGKYPKNTKVVRKVDKTSYFNSTALEYTREANEVIRENLYRLSVTIQTLRA